jgi:hypothetical protein
VTNFTDAGLELSRKVDQSIFFFIHDKKHKVRTEVDLGVWNERQALARGRGVWAGCSELGTE